jgi:hypothetical protein
MKIRKNKCLPRNPDRTKFKWTITYQLKNRKGAAVLLQNANIQLQQYQARIND